MCYNKTFLIEGNELSADSVTVHSIGWIVEFIIRSKELNTERPRCPCPVERATGTSPYPCQFPWTRATRTLGTRLKVFKKIATFGCFHGHDPLNYDFVKVRDVKIDEDNVLFYYFGGARSKGFSTLRNVSKLTFLGQDVARKVCRFSVFSAIWRSEISSRYREITSISLIYSLTYSRKKELLFWISRGLNRLNCVTRQIRGDSKLRDYPIALLLPKVVRNMKNS